MRADCDRCAALCCVVPAFAKSSAFALDKPAGHPCPNLAADFRCGIHAQLREEGFGGCSTYDCFGAGQQVVQVTFGGRTWRTEPAVADEMFAVFPVMRELHELRWYVTAALEVPGSIDLRPDLIASLEKAELIASGSAADVLGADLASMWEVADGLLRRTSELARAPYGGAELSRADLVGADLRGRDMRGANLRGTYLIGADLRGVDLRMADLIGADLRDADLRGADLTGCLFLTPQQLASAVTR